MGAIDKVTKLDIETIVAIVQVGLGYGMGKRAPTDLGEKIWRSGLTDDGAMVERCVTYLRTLANGGRPPPPTRRRDEVSIAKPAMQEHSEPLEWQESYQKYLDDLAEVALGWLHWSEEQLLSSDISSILTGYAGMQAMLTSIFGSAKPDGEGNLTYISPPPTRPPAPAPEVPVLVTPTDKLPLTPEDFDRMFSADVTSKVN